MKTILVDVAYTFTIEVDGKFIIFNELNQLLDSYPNRKIILTNANDEQTIEYGLVDLPYELFSLKHNTNKTDPEYFTKFLNQYCLDPKDVVYFEHDSSAVNSAKSVGIVSYFYDSNKKDLIALKQFINKNI